MSCVAYIGTLISIQNDMNTMVAPFTYDQYGNVLWGGFEERELVNPEDYTIVNVSKQEYEDSNEHWIPLNDGVYDGGTSLDNFSAAVELVIELLEKEQPLLVHCAAGQSRSVSVLATALAVYEQRNIDSVIEEMVAQNNGIRPEESVLSKGKEYIKYNHPQLR